MKKRMFVLFAAFVFSISGVFAQKADSSDVRIVVQEGHSGSVYQVEYLKNGKLIGSSDDVTVKIWDAESGLLIRDITKKKASGGKTVAFDPAGKFVAYTSGEDNLEVCEIANGKVSVIEKLPEGLHTDSIAISRDGKYLAKPVGYSKISLYNANGFTKTVLSDVEVKGFYDVAFTPDSSMLAVCCSGRNEGTISSIAFFDVKTGNLVKTIDIGSHLEKLTFSPNGKFAVCLNHFKEFKTGDKKHISVVDVKAGKVFKTIDVDFHLGDIKVSPDSKFIYATGSSKGKVEGLACWSIDKGNLQPVPKHATLTYGITFADDGKSYLVGCYRELEIRDASDYSLVRKIKGQADLHKLAYLEDMETFLVPSFGKNKSFFVNEKFRKTQIAETVPGIDDFSLSGNKIYYAKGSDKYGYKIYSYTFGEKEEKVVKELTSINETVNVIRNSTETLMLLHAYKSKTLYAYNMKTDKLIYKINTDRQFYSDSYITPGQKYVVLNSTGDKTEIYEAKSGKKIELPVDYKYSNVTFSYDGKLCAANTAAGVVSIYDTSKWTELKTVRGFGASVFSHNGKYLVVGNAKGYLVFYDVASKKEVRKILTGGIGSFYFNKDDTKFVGLTYGGIIRCWSVETGEVLVSTLVNKEGDWLTYTPEGYFMGSEKGMQEFVHVADGLKVIELGQLYDALYRADLVEAKLEQKTPQAGTRTLALAQVVSSGDAPVVSFADTSTVSKTRTKKVTVNVKDNGGGIGTVYLCVNGRAYQIAKYGTTGKDYTVSCDITLSNGDNIIEAYATNASDKLESRHTITKTVWSGKADLPSLYVLVLGVNKYDAKFVTPLKYAVPDAKSVANLFKQSSGNIYQKVNVSELYDADVTQGSIAREFSKLSSVVKPDDVFVFYLAGHGTMYDGDYYYIPADFRARNEKDLTSMGISKQFLIENLSRISAQKTLVLFDTCQSGSFVEQSAFDRLAHSTGLAIIAASTDVQSACEGYNGHGVFTYAILEALSGKADFMNKGNVSVSALSYYVNNTVPSITMTKWKIPQTPWSYILKEDFIIVGKIQGGYDSKGGAGVDLNTVKGGGTAVVVTKTETPVKENKTDSKQKSKSAKVSALDEKYELGMQADIEGRYADAFMLFLEASEAGHVESTNMLGQYYYYGISIQKDSSKAFELFQAASKKGSQEATCYLGLCYILGEGVKEDQKKGFGLIQSAAAKEDPYSMNILSLFYERGWLVKKDFQKAISLCQKAANAGNGPAQTHMGDYYFYGNLLKRDYQKAYEWYEKSAENGHSYAFYMLGYMHDNGLGVPQDYNKAAEFYQKACDRKVSDAMNALGYMYWNGFGVKQSDAKAYELIKEAADLGHSIAQANIGYMYENGSILKKNEKNAFEWYKLAAENGNVYSQYKTGYFYENGIGTEKNPAEAVKFYEKACENNHVDALVTLGKMYYFGRGVKEDNKRAFELFSKAADQESAEGIFYLGGMYQHGYHVSKDYVKAKELYEKAAGYNYAPAQNSLGVLYNNGYGVTKDFAKAKEWYEKAVVQGNEYAMFNLALMYENGEGVTQDYLKAKELYEKAMEKNHASSITNLGFLYNQGNGVKKDQAKAYELYLRAAELGNAQACHNLGVMLENGEGVTKSIPKAKEWYQKAADKGHENAKKALQRLNGSGSVSANKWLVPIYGLNFNESTEKDIARIGKKVSGYDFYEINGNHFLCNGNKKFYAVSAFYRSWPKEWDGTGYDKEYTRAQWVSFLKSRGYTITKDSGNKIEANAAKPVPHVVYLTFDNGKINNLYIYAK